MFLATLVSVPQAGAVAPPESCEFDPALGPAGFALTEVIDDGYQLDRMTLDRSGRLYTINTLLVDDSYALDRVRRFLPNGQLDTTFGSDGSVDLPGQMFSATGRVLAVDDVGRVWIARNSYTNVRQIRRLTPAGELDVSIPLLELAANFGSGPSFDLVGAMVADGSDVVLGHTISSNSYIGISHVRISSDGIVTRNDFRRVEGSNSAYIAAIDPSGWMGGALEFDGVTSPLLWDGNPEAQAYWPYPLAGAISALTESDGVVTAVGLLDGGEEIGEVFSLEFGPDRPGYLDAPPRPDGSELTRSGTNAMPIGLLPNRGVVSFMDSDDGVDLAFGALGAEGTISISTRGATPGTAAFPVPAVVNDDGDFTVAGYVGVDSNQAFIIGLTPELGPVVSDEALDDQVSRLYEAYYLRAPDAGGRAFWREQRASGASLEAISAQFATAPEFFDLYGDLSDEAFVDLIYTNVLGRLGDDSGRAFWTTQLTLGARTRGSVMLEFSESDENLVRTGTVAAHDDETGAVYRLYKAYFDRAPDAGGSCFWVRRLVGGAGLDDVSDSFASSQEFADTYGSLSNREFVELVYSNVLGRPGEVNGVDFWTASLDDESRTRGQVMVGFSESPEYIERTGTLPIS